MPALPRPIAQLVLCRTCGTGRGALRLGDLETFGWMKTIGNFRRTRFKGQALTNLALYLVGAAYNLIRMAKLLSAPA